MNRNGAEAVAAISFVRPVPVTDLTAPAQLEAALQASHRYPVVLFKHSRTCPVSMLAHWSMQGLDADSDPDLYRIVVQTARGLSDDVAHRFGVRHESPQALVVSEGRVIGHWSHGSVRAETVRDLMQTLTPDVTPDEA